MQRITLGAIAGIGIGLLALLSEALPGQQEWIVFGALAGAILSLGKCDRKTNGGGDS